ncbi:MAG: flagellar hook-basal body complex protein FliE, partial [Candidatus Nealsonbacteria bacterium]|nr:flagellar hook-basal body complex protein FliE [Candidatus Nealsonbacteria bacterium]
MNPINGISLPNALSGLGGPSSPQGAGASGTSFKNFLLESIHEVNSMQKDADMAVEQLAGGGDVDPAEVLTAVQ